MQEGGDRGLQRTKKKAPRIAPSIDATLLSIQRKRYCAGAVVLVYCGKGGIFEIVCVFGRVTAARFDRQQRRAS